MVRSQHIVTARLLLLTLFTARITTSSSFTFVLPQQKLQQSTPNFLHSLHAEFLTASESDKSSIIPTEVSKYGDLSTLNFAWKSEWSRNFATMALGVALLVAPNMAVAENELSAKYGNSGFDTSLVDQTCLLDHCSLQAKACLQDDPNCRKGLTCTAKCLGDNSCITGCMARYGDAQLDSLLKCTIEDHECIKVAILPGGSDTFGEEPKSPAPTISNFDVQSLQGSWYKVVGYNPNYDCYACQRNTFNAPSASSSSSNRNALQMDVEFSMPHLLPDGSPLPPSGVRETLNVLYDGDETMQTTGLKSMALNDYHTNEIMIFDQPNNHHKNQNPMQQLVFHPGTEQERSYSRTAHSEGEMFGLSTYPLLFYSYVTMFLHCSHFDQSISFFP
jgi:VDE lipocalin domain